MFVFFTFSFLFFFWIILSLKFKISADCLALLDMLSGIFGIGDD